MLLLSAIICKFSLSFYIAISLAYFTDLEKDFILFLFMCTF